MSLVNIVFPILSHIDRLLAEFIPPYIRVCVWGVASGSLTMTLYALLSPQQRIREKKQQARELRLTLASSEGEFDEVLALSLQNLKQSLSLLGIVLGPTLLSSIPILSVIVWLGTFYSHEEPLPGTPVSITALPAAKLTIAESDSRVFEDKSVPVWPETGESVPIMGPDRIELTRLPHQPPVNAVHKRQWWNIVVGNEAGYIPENSVVEQLSFGLKRWHLLDGIPDWMATWEFPFFASVLIWSIALKVLFRIE